MLVAEAVGRTLAGLGVDTVFGVVGSGNFHVTNALVAAGGRYVAARHECGAATMADAYARTSRKVGAISVHQGCVLTNAMTGITAVAKGMFNGNPWYLDVSGGFASPLAAELIRGADLIVGWGCALNMWTMRHGALIGPDATVVQVDLDADAIGAHRPVDLGVVGDVDQTALAVAAQLGGPADGYRSEELRQRIAREHRWRDVPFEDESGGGRIDPRTLSIALDDLLPDERVVAIDSGNFMGYPSMYLSVPDDDGFCFTQAFQSIG